DGSLHTHHLGLGKHRAEIDRDGRVWLRGLREGRRDDGERRLLSRFVAGLPRGLDRAARVRGNAPRIEGITQTQKQFRLMDPPSRWFDSTVQVWGDLIGDRRLGAAASRRAVQAAAQAWNDVPGSSLALSYA